MTALRSEPLSPSLTIPRTGMLPFVASESSKTQDRLAEQSISAPDFSIIVPTRNEADNVSELLRRLAPVVQDAAAEIIFVDDSTDATPDTINDAAGSYFRPVRLIHRLADQRAGGLGGAVLEGLRAARGPYVIVMDGDLQHPPEVIPRLLDEARNGARDLVVASRYCANGSAGSFSRARSLLSQGSTLAAKGLFPARLRHVNDPMSGYFLVRRAALDLNALQPNGFKILLEIIGKTRNLRIASVPFAFGERHAGESKASLKEGLRFLTLLLTLRLGTGVMRFGMFGLVGVSGLLVNSLLLAFWTETIGIYYLASLILATQGSSLWNFFLSEFWVFGKTADAGQRVHRGVKFLFMNNAALLARGPIVFGLTSFLGVNYLISNVASMLVLLLLRFAVADSLIWKLNTPVAVQTPTLPSIAQEHEVAA